MVRHEKRSRELLIWESTTSNDEDENGLKMSHNDALVITLWVFDTNAQKV